MTLKRVISILGSPLILATEIASSAIWAGLYLAHGTSVVAVTSAVALFLIPPVAYVINKLWRTSESLALSRKELETALTRAETADKAKSEFLANMSHELRTPLNAIVGFSDAILDEIHGPIGDHRYKDFVCDVRDAGRHLQGLIDQVLDLSKIEAGRMELAEREVEIAAVTDLCRRLVSQRATDKGVRIEICDPPSPSYVMADELRLKQIILNLLTNAIKFTPAGGVVTVRAGAARGGFSLEVADTGIGMSPNEAARALEPFRQVHGEHHTKQPGTGLGLSIAKALVELHGGRLIVNSTPGAGTTVMAVLPASRVVRETAA